MRPFVVNGDLWRVVPVRGGDPRLVDRTGVEKLATTDPSTMAVYVRADLRPPLLDRVMLHEVAHAITYSWGMLENVRHGLPNRFWVQVEEWAAQLVEGHSLEALEAATIALGRPVCVGGVCYD